jgi:glycosyltransferase involved in cell wall biosynthesis
VGNAEVAYLMAAPRDAFWALSQLREWRPNVTYLNGLHSNFTLAALAARKAGCLKGLKVVLAARGDCSPAALDSKSRKKRVARPWIKWLIGSDITWHASSDNELADISRWWGSGFPPGHEWVVAVDDPPLPQEEPSQGSSGDVPVVVFASRIDQIKGLDFAIETVSHLKRPTRFVVAGVVSDAAYWGQCLSLADRLPPWVTFEYSGPYSPASSKDIYSRADAFLFPSRGENFGHAVADALAVGCPVLAREGVTLWDPVLRAGGSGFLGDPILSALQLEAILSASALDKLHRRGMVLQAYRSWYERRHSETHSSSGRSGKRLLDVLLLG